MAPQRTQRSRPITIATIAGALSFVLPAATLIRLAFRSSSILPLAWTSLLSTVTFFTYGYDKMQARNREWRVRETTLHTLEVLGGWPGAMFGQHYFQHKTTKKSFQVPFWGIVLGWQVVWWAIWRGRIRFPVTAALRKVR